MSWSSASEVHHRQSPNRHKARASLDAGLLDALAQAAPSSEDALGVSKLMIASRCLTLRGGALLTSASMWAWIAGVRMIMPEPYASHFTSRPSTQTRPGPPPVRRTSLGARSGRSICDDEGSRPAEWWRFSTPRGSVVFFRGGGEFWEDHRLVNDLDEVVHGCQLKH
jgi:hypothetical protein